MYFVHVYIYIFFLKNSKKKFQDFQIFLKKKREKFSNEKSIWTRGIEPLSHLKKKKKFFELGAVDFLVTFSKKTHFFLSKVSRFYSLLFKMVHEDPLDKIFFKLWCLKA